MTNLASTLKSEMGRVARRETKGEIDSLRKSVAQHRSDLAALKRRTLDLERLTKGLAKSLSKGLPSQPQANEGGETKLRFRAGGFATLRKKLGLSAEAMGKLLRVSGQSVYHWEQGKASPRTSQLPAIAAVRKLGKREAQARLAKLGCGRCSRSPSVLYRLGPHFHTNGSKSNRFSIS
jgi:DNA-binding transcriptional regulator YiaG